MTTRREDWDKVHQPFELAYHKKSNYRWRDADFAEAWAAIFAGFANLRPESFADDEIIVDIGCGSRPPFNCFFTSGRKVFIEPLADKYAGIPEVGKHWEETPEVLVIAEPAENRQNQLNGRCAFVNCWNVLDHCFNWQLVLRNMLALLRPGGTFLLCTDTKPHGEGHPGIDDVASLIARIFNVCSIEKMEINHFVAVNRDIALLGTKRLKPADTTQTLTEEYEDDANKRDDHSTSEDEPIPQSS